MRSSTMMFFAVFFVAAASAAALSILSKDDYASDTNYSPKLRPCDTTAECPIGFDCMGYRCICRKIWDRKAKRCLEFPTTIPSVISILMPTTETATAMPTVKPNEIDSTTTTQATYKKQEQSSIRKMINKFLRNILAFVIYFICATLISMLIIACYLKLMDIPRWNFMCQVIMQFCDDLWTRCTRPQPREQDV